MLHSMISNPQQWFEISKGILTKKFGEYVCYLLWICTVKYINGTIMHNLPDILHMDLNVLGSLYLNWIIRDLNGAFIFTTYDNGSLWFDPTYSKYSLQPETLSSYIHNSSLLCLYRWECYGTLLLTWLDNCSICKHEQKILK